MQVPFTVSNDADGIVRIGGIPAIGRYLQRPLAGAEGAFTDHQPLDGIVIGDVLGIFETGKGVMPEYDRIDGIGRPGLAGCGDPHGRLCNR